LFCNVVKPSGYVKIIAPLPKFEGKELPYTLVAITLANTDDPHGRLKGAAIRVEIETLHEVVLMVVESVPSYSAISNDETRFTASMNT